MLHDEERAPHVDVELGIEEVLVDGGAGREPGDACVDEKDVDAAMPRHDLVDQRLRGSRISGVGLYDVDAAHLAARDVQRRGIGAGDDDCRPLRLEPAGGRRSDAGRAAGDEGDLVCELGHLTLLFCTGRYVKVGSGAVNQNLYRSVAKPAVAVDAAKART